MKRASDRAKTRGSLHVVLLGRRGWFCRKHAAASAPQLAAEAGELDASDARVAGREDAAYRGATRPHSVPGSVEKIAGDDHIVHRIIIVVAQRQFGNQEPRRVLPARPAERHVLHRTLLRPVQIVQWYG